MAESESGLEVVELVSTRTTTATPATALLLPLPLPPPLLFSSYLRASPDARDSNSPSTGRGACQGTELEEEEEEEAEEQERMAVAATQRERQQLSPQQRPTHLHPRPPGPFTPREQPWHREETPEGRCSGTSLASTTLCSAGTEAALPQTLLLPSLLRGVPPPAPPSSSPALPRGPRPAWRRCGTWRRRRGGWRT